MDILQSTAALPSALAPLRRGHVTLVGAGPGDPELLTLKAVRAIAAASVLLVDDLVNEAVLQHAAPTARVLRVGKRGGCRSTPQAFIERLMLRCARAGENVVRLKGGDPFIFGRGGEEVAYLQAAGVAVTVLNGISAGLAAVTTLGVPLTQRTHAHGVVFVTGHAQAGSPGTDWAALATCAAQARLTLVIYMGVGQVDTIERGLLQGLSPHTPIAIVERASLPEQRHAVATLERLAQTLRLEALASPAIIVVGDVLQGLLAMQTQSAAEATERAA